MVVLDAIKNVLQAMDSVGKREAICDTFEEIGLVDHLERLQAHENEEVCELGPLFRPIALFGHRLSTGAREQFESTSILLFQIYRLADKLLEDNWGTTIEEDVDEVKVAPDGMEFVFDSGDASPTDRQFDF